MELDGKGIPQRGKVDPVYKYPLGNPNVMEAHIFQLKDNIPASMGGGTMWLSVGSPRFAPYHHIMEILPIRIQLTKLIQRSTTKIRGIGLHLTFTIWRPNTKNYLAIVYRKNGKL